MFNGKTYRAIINDSIFMTADISYYSCRAPDGRCVMLAECRDEHLAEVLRDLEAAHRTMADEAGFYAQFKCDVSKCNDKRRCLEICFLPYIIDEGKGENGSYLYALSYRCFLFGKMVRAQDLVQSAYKVQSAMATRLTVSLLTLVDRLIRMKVVVDLSLENLLIDLDSTFATLIDWSSASCFEESIPLQILVTYYNQVAEIVLELMHIPRIDSNWQLTDDLKQHEARTTLELLIQMSEWSLDLPSDLREAVDYAIDLRVKQQSVLKSLVDNLWIPKIKEG